MAEMKIGCAADAAPKETHTTPTKAPVLQDIKEDTHMIRIGKPAPDFTVPAYKDGNFTQVRLSDFKGQWVMLCFYPGDFTFV